MAAETEKVGERAHRERGGKRGMRMRSSRRRQREKVVKEVEGREMWEVMFRHAVIRVRNAFA